MSSRRHHHHRPTSKLGPNLVAVFERKLRGLGTLLHQLYCIYQRLKPHNVYLSGLYI